MDNSRLSIINFNVHNFAALLFLVLFTKIILHLVLTDFFATVKLYCSVFGTQSQIIMKINIKSFVFSLLKQFIFLGTKHILQSKLNIVMTKDENCFRSRACTIQPIQWN